MTFSSTTLMSKFLLATSLLSTQAFRPILGQAARRSMAASCLNIDDTIKANDVVIFSKSYCPFCAKTKALFQSLNVDADIYELDQRDDGAEIQSKLKEKTGQSTVPNVFIKGEHLGGNDDTQRAHASGKLAELLA
uniref:Glutaredoxin domain-containing protein n=1 Tax=Aureoumbra lagunensis TaxID=44058 RepID=A0A7S3NI43_9STRA